MSPETKRPLLELLTREVECGGQRGPLMVALHRYVASLVKCFEGSGQALEIPVAVPEDGTVMVAGGGSTEQRP